MAWSNMPTFNIPGNVAVVAPIRLKGTTALTYWICRSICPLAADMAMLGHKSNKDETVAKLISFIK